MEPENDGKLDQSPDNDGLAKARAAARYVGSKGFYSENELKKFFDDEWGES